MREPSHYVRFVPMLSKKSAGGAGQQQSNWEMWPFGYCAFDRYLEIKVALAPDAQNRFSTVSTQSRRWMSGSIFGLDGVRAIVNCGWSRYTAFTVCARNCS